MNKKFTAILISIFVVCGIMATAVPAMANETSQTLQVSQWSGPATLENVSGRQTTIKVGDIYHMWYANSDETELYHTSSEKSPGSFTTGTKTTFGTNTDAPAEVGSVTVYHENGTFYMIAYGTTDDVFNIYTSSDGNTWTNKGIVFDGNNLPDSYSKIDAPYLFKDNNTYRLYFQVKNSDKSRYEIYTAEATSGTTLASIADGNDDAFTLANNNNAVLSPGESKAWDGTMVMHPMVIKDGGLYYMWYSAHNANSPQQIGMATSTDGYNWVKSTGNPILPCDSPYVAKGEPSVITDGATWQMWYLTTQDGINYLTATEPFEFSTIQSAVNAASNNDTINVATGTYEEAILIDGKDLTIQSAGTPVLTGGTDGQYIIKVANAAVTLDGLTVDGTDKNNIEYGVWYDDAGGEVKNCTVQSIENNATNGNSAIRIENSPVNITDNTIKEFFKNGIFVKDPGSTGTISGNEIILRTINDANEVQYGVQVGWGADVTIEDNTIYDSTIASVNVYDWNWTSSGILVLDFKAENGGSSADIINNTIHHCMEGVHIGYQKVEGDTSYGLIQDNYIHDCFYCVGVVGDAHADITNNTIEMKDQNVIDFIDDGEGIFIGGGWSNVDEYPTVTITNNSIDNFDMGIDIYEFADVNITGNDITNNDYGIYTNANADKGWAQTVVAHNNNFIGNSEYGVDNFENSATFDATNNWWGEASGPGGEGSGAGDAVSENVDYRPWLLAENGENTEDIDTFDQTIALTEAGKWALVSADKLLSEAPTIIDDGSEGATAVLAYVDNAWVSSGAVFNADVIKPVSAFFVKTIGKGGIGFKYKNVDAQAIPSKNLVVNSWNLVGTNNNGIPDNEFSTVKPKNDLDGKGVTTLNVPTVFNKRKDLSGEWSSDASNSDIDITNWPEEELNAYDGYWVYSNAERTYSKITSK